MEPLSRGTMIQKSLETREKFPDLVLRFTKSYIRVRRKMDLAILQFMDDLCPPIVLR